MIVSSAITFRSIRGYIALVDRQHSLVKRGNLGLLLLALPLVLNGVTRKARSDMGHVSSVTTAQQVRPFC